MFEGIVANKTYFVFFAPIVEVGWKHESMVGVLGAEHGRGLLRNKDILFLGNSEWWTYRGKFLVERDALIITKLVLTNVNGNLTHFFCRSFVGIECRIIATLTNVGSRYYLVAKECDGVKIVTKAKRTFTNMLHFIGYSHVLQFLAIVESIITNLNDGRR